MSPKILCTLPAALFAFIGAGTLWADDDYNEAWRLREAESILPLELIIERAGLTPDTRILEVETEIEQGRIVYEIAYLDPRGRVMEVYVDARTGEVLKHEQED